MSGCDFCGTESNLSFICKKCNGRFCREHRAPDLHDCVSIIESQFETSVEETVEFTEEELEDSLLQVEQIEPRVEEELIDDDLLLTESEEESAKDSKIIGSFLIDQLKTKREIIIFLLIGVIIGTVLVNAIIYFNPMKNEDDNLRDYFLELQANFANLTTEYEDLKLRFFALEDEMKKVEEDYLKKTEEYNALFENYSMIADSENNWLTYLDNDLENPSVPSISELESWLETDETDRLNPTSDLTELHNALIFALRARENHWKIGITSINGNFTSNEQTTHVFNTVFALEGLIYIDSRTDDLWWYENDLRITPDKVWNIGLKKVQVNEVKKILSD